MIIHAAYAGPPFPQAPCATCTRGPEVLQPADGTSPLAGLSYTSIGTLIMAALAITAVGITLYSINGKKKSLAGRRSRR